MGISTSVMVAITELRTVAKEEGTVKERLLATMKEARSHWLVTNDEEQFKAAVGAVIMESDHETQERIRAEMRVLNTVGAAAAGIPVDWEAFVEDVPSDPIGLLALWQSTGRKAG